MIPPVSIRFCCLLTCTFILLMLLLNVFSYQNPWFTEYFDLPQPRYEGELSKKSKIEKGMVMCVGNNDDLIAGALYTILLLRDVYKSDLHVSVNHCSELSIGTQKLFTKYKNVTVKNMCGRETTKRQSKRMKGWFCKTMALVSSDFTETMVVDTDVLWFQDPFNLYKAPNYLSTGALFFRDRFLYESPTEKDGLEMDTVKRFIEVESDYKVKINATTAKILAESNGINFFWRNAQNSTKYKAIRHVQESSVIIMDKSRLPKTIEVLRRLFDTFDLGYGDKEIYWIAATIAQEDFSFEPYLAGSYGDCGEIIHFNPIIDPINPINEALKKPLKEPAKGDNGSNDVPNVATYFLNCQYLAEGLDNVGKNIQDVISKPVRAIVSTEMFDMGEKDKKSAGRCGACKSMGCSPIPGEMNEAIRSFQRFQLERRTIYTTVRRKIDHFFEKLF